MCSQCEVRAEPTSLSSLIDEWYVLFTIRGARPCAHKHAVTQDVVSVRFLLEHLCMCHIRGCAHALSMRHLCAKRRVQHFKVTYRSPNLMQDPYWLQASSCDIVRYKCDWLQVRARHSVRCLSCCVMFTKSEATGGLGPDLRRVLSLWLRAYGLVFEVQCLGCRVVNPVTSLCARKRAQVCELTAIQRSRGAHATLFSPQATNSALNRSAAAPLKTRTH